MIESLIEKEDIERAELKDEWVRVKTPSTSNFYGSKTYNHYGRLIKVTDDHILLFSQRMGLNKIPLCNILFIGRAIKPQGEI